MSKIQDALSKLQSSQPQRAVGASLGLDDSGLRKQARIAEYRGKTIYVNRDILRAKGFLAPEHDTRGISEAFRDIKRPILKNLEPENRKLLERANVVQVASAVSGEGKSFTCINLALSISQERDLEVLLIDGDVLKPEITQLFDVTDQPGLLDVLADKTINLDECIMPTDINGISFLGAGSKRQLTTELLASRRMDALIGALADANPDRVIIIDSSPLLLASDAAVVSSHVGQVLLVVKAAHTLRHQVMEAVGKIDSSKAVNLVLNQARFGGETLEYGQYGYGYGSA